MKSPAVRFNIYLLLPLLLLVACKSGPFAKDKLTTLRFYLEVNPDGTDKNGPVSVYRTNPVYLNVAKDPFLKEGHVSKATVKESPGGFEIELEFERKGRLLLEQFSSAYKGKRFVIYSLWEDARFLAAPVIRHPYTNGVFTFTPDATREEADRIVLGLNNVAKQVESGKY